MIRRHYDRWTAIVAALVLAFAVVGILRRPGLASSLEGEAPPSRSTLFEAGVEPPTVTRERIRWPEPAPARSWRYDVFTPPAIHRVDGALRLAASVAGGKNALPAAGAVLLELLEVKTDAFPLQLVGHTGAGKSVRGVFELGSGGETVLARAGSRFPSVGLAVRRLEVKRRRATAADDGPPGVEATAVVFDELTGEETVLTTRERRLRSAPAAVLRFKESGSVHEARAGDRLEVGTLAVTVEQIDVSPPAVRLTMQSVAAAASGPPRELTLTVLPSPR